MEITNLNQLDFSKKYSYADYLQWKFKERVELLRGNIFKMIPAPGRLHQDLLRNINRIFDRNFYGHPCKVYFAPFDVRLPNADGDIVTVVQPDLCVVCDPSKLDARGCLGAPDLVVEILSPGNTVKEYDLKFSVYEEAGVKEYWIVHPTDRNIQVFVLEDGRYIGLKPFTENQTMISRTFPDLVFSTDEVWVDLD